jgi:hypothetical protein
VLPVCLGLHNLQQQQQQQQQRRQSTACVHRLGLLLWFSARVCLEPGSDSTRQQLRSTTCYHALRKHEQSCVCGCAHSSRVWRAVRRATSTSKASTVCQLPAACAVTACCVLCGPLWRLPHGAVEFERRTDAHAA